MLTSKEFAAQIKEKYPVYASMNDNELTMSIIEKYPVYKSQVQIEEKPASFGVTREFKTPKPQKEVLSQDMAKPDLSPYAGFWPFRKAQEYDLLRTCKARR